MQQKVILLILDGWGITQDPAVSAISLANTPFIDSLKDNYPNSQLRTDGEHVGLPHGQMGNSEVGHMNLGAGRVVFQDLAKINNSLADDSLKDEPVLKQAFEYAKTYNKKIHFLGLVSDGGVHSHINHLKGLLTAAHNEQLTEVFVHAFTDGRDVDPHSGKGYIKELQAHMKQSTGQLASVIGRYFAMDRDNRWERVQKAYDLLVHGVGHKSDNACASIQEFYDQGISDEFMEAIVMQNQGNPVATIQEDDVVVFFNFRTDRGRQLTQALTQKDKTGHGLDPLKLYFVTLTNYDNTFADIKVVFNKDNLINTLGEVLEHEHKTQIRIAETEKYPHVTFFFSGGRETAFHGERRILCPSPKVATYDLQPEMSAYQVRDKIISEIKTDPADFICLNFANPDMVGHTGDIKAAAIACETVDACTRDIVDAALQQDYYLIIIADHGNSETMINPDGSPNTAHTTNPVPCYLVGKNAPPIKDGILADVAPTILQLMNIPIPEQMTGRVLI